MRSVTVKLLLVVALLALIPSVFATNDTTTEAVNATTTEAVNDTTTEAVNDTTTTAEASAGTTTAETTTEATNGTGETAPPNATSPNEPPSPTPSLPAYCESVNCTCLFKAVISDGDVSKQGAKYVEPIAFTAQAQYRACSGMTFGGFLTYQWELLQNGTNALGSIRSNGSTLVLPARYLTPETAYTVKVTVTGVRNDTWEWSETVTVARPLPVVRLGGVSSEMRTGPTNIVVAASITVAVGAVTGQGTWNCSAVAGGNCPTAITTALAAATNTGVTIDGPVAAGSYVLTLTYESQTATLTLNVADTAVPTITIEAQTPALVEPLKYVYKAGRVLTFRGRVTSAIAVTGLVWKLNGAALPTTSEYAVVNMTTFVRGALNNLTLRANTASGYGETTVQVEVSAAPTFSVTNVANVDVNGATSATALQDRIRLTVLVSDAAVFGIPFTYVVKFDDVRDGSTVRVALRAPQVSGSTLTFPAPMPTTSADSVSVTFVVEAVAGQEVAATATTAFTVTIGSRAAAASSLSGQLGVTDDTDSTLGILLSLGPLLAGNAALKSEYAGQAMARMASIADNAASLSDNQKGQMVDTLGSAVTNATAANAVDVLFKLKVPADKVETALAVLLIAIASGAGGNKAVEATTSIALSMLGATPIGESKSVTKGDVTVTTTQIVVGSTESKLSGTSSSVTVPAGGIPGLASGSVGGIIAAEYATDPLGTNASTTSKLVSISIVVNGTELTVTGLNPGLLIEIESSNPILDQCNYFDTILRKFSGVGVTKVGATLTSIRCRTTHLTSFAGVAGSSSSAAVVVASMATVAVATLLTLFASA